MAGVALGRERLDQSRTQYTSAGPEDWNEIATIMTRKDRKSGGRYPSEHTVVIADAATMWAKLAWDVDNFSELQRDYPDLAEPLGFAAVNVCIAAWSLKNWAWAAFARQERQHGRNPAKQEFHSRLYAAVPEQRMCEAIANTAKHAALEEGEWRGGTVRIEWIDADEDTPGTYILRQHQTGVDGDTLALSRFGDLERNWLDFLKSLRFHAPRHVYDLEFRQRRLRQIFGIRGGGETDIS